MSGLSSYVLCDAIWLYSLDDCCETSVIQVCNITKVYTYVGFVEPSSCTQLWRYSIATIQLISWTHLTNRRQKRVPNLDGIACASQPVMTRTYSSKLMSKHQRQRWLHRDLKLMHSDSFLYLVDNGILQGECFSRSSGHWAYKSQHVAMTHHGITGSSATRRSDAVFGSDVAFPFRALSSHEPQLSAGYAIT